MSRHTNVDPATVDGFGAEWSRFAYEDETPELRELFEQYFSVFPWDRLPKDSVGVDIGCGSGRWARLAAPRVGLLHCVDASPDALGVCERNTRGLGVQTHRASAGALPFETGSLDFAYSLGVLHHVPDTAGAIREAARVLKPGAPLLLYLYYALDNRPAWFRGVWRASDLLRRGISRLPDPARFVVAEVLAATVYLPLSRAARLVSEVDPTLAQNIPLSAYKDRSYYVLRTDALDRFGTRLEQRFTQRQIEEMFMDAGFENVRFRAESPYWCAVGTRR